MDERIRKLRRYFDLTQQEFAEKVGTTRNNIAGYETGKRLPSMAVVSAICDKCNVNEQWLRTGEGAMFAPEIEDALGAFIRERNLTSTDRILIEKFVSLSAKSRLAVVQYVIGIADALWEECKASVQQRAEPDTNGQGQAHQGNLIYITNWFSTMPMSAGTGQPAGSEEPVELELAKRPPRGTSYIATVSGDSMEPTFHNGDKLFIHTCAEIEPGQVGVFFMDGQQWVKELGGGELISHNPKYAPRPITEDIICQGLVLGVCDDSYFEQQRGE